MELFDVLLTIFNASNTLPLPHYEEFYIWRDTHVLREIYKYGWYIDYWMENGLMRDVSVQMRNTCPSLCLSTSSRFCCCRFFLPALLS
jgi:hypothetical protein